MNADQPLIKKATIIIEENRITEIGSENDITIPVGSDILKLGDYHIIFPGFVNAHTHASMTLLRGYADDLPVVEWLTTKIFPLEEQLKPDDIYTGTKLACVESMLGGTTCFNSMYHMMQNEAQAIADTGMRGVVGHVCFEWRKEHDLKETTSLASEWHDKADGRVRISVDPHAPYTVSPEYYLQLKDLTTDLNNRYGKNGIIAMHLHLAETDNEEVNTVQFLKEQNIDAADFGLQQGSGIFAYLDKIGFFNETPDSGPYTTAAHCVGLKDVDYTVISKYPNRISIAHCPVSNLKLGSGIAPLPEILSNKIMVGLGTDGTSSNNSLSMLETIKMTALLHKGIQKRADIIKADEVLRMATSGKTIYWNRLGKLKKGYLADIVAINLKKPHLMPIHDIKSHLVYSAKSNDVEHVICNGEVLVENGSPLKIDLEQLFEDVEEKKRDILSRLDST
jgi:5-methylthioadenosine/S-adenosylhomocysteine deaminase